MGNLCHAITALSPKTEDTLTLTMPSSTASAIALCLLFAGWHVSSFAPVTHSAVMRSAVKTSIAPINNVEAFMGISTEVRKNPEVLQFPPKFDASVDIEIGEGYETMTEEFSAAFSNGASSLACVEASLPLGMVLEESETFEGKFEIAEVLGGGNAEKAGVQVGDIFRACSAQRGPAPSPKVFPKKALFTAEKQTFEACMGALATNSPANGGTGRIAMVFERKHER